MPKDEKILKKIGKLLTLYGVEDQEKENFLIDLQDKKYDDPDDEEEIENKEEEKVDENSAEVETETEVEEKAEPTKDENQGGEEQPETEVEEEQEVEEKEEVPGEEERVEEKVENEIEEPQLEEPQPEQPTEEFDYQAKFEEQQKSIDGLLARLSTLEEIVSKLGVEEKPVGASPEGNPIEESNESTFDEINRKRVGY